MGIIVEWSGETEYLDDVDPGDLDGLEPFHTTKAWWPDENDGGKFVEYNVETEINRLDDRVVVVVKYAEDQNRKNPDFQGRDIYWGVNRIILKQGEDNGNYVWKPERWEKFKSKGTEYGWKTQNLRESRSRRKSQQKRERDAQFRPRILDLDKQTCVISGETTEAALDAAHIISDADNGNEISKNGIALRTDIHRLYDAGKFVIHPENGKPVRIDRYLSPAYKKLLKRAALPPATLERVQEALWEIWPK